MTYLKRIADSLLSEKLQAFGAVLIVGPKGCGKTTTAKQQAKSVIEFQDEDNRDKYLSVANEFPSKLLIGEKPRLFDEWQDAPKIWGAIRKSIDDEQLVGAYILTGSSSRFVETPHTGTGRISTLKMYPMSLYESGESGGEVSLTQLFEDKSMDFVESKLTIDQLIFAICRGGWPRSVNSQNYNSKLAIAEDLVYQTAYVDISNIDKTKRNPLWSQNIVESIFQKYLLSCRD
jgi:predicted AAA+ superfamily ATPase